VEKNKLEGRRLSLQEGLFDFRVGYIGTVILAVCFVTLGANAFYGSGVTLAASSVKFAGQLIGMYGRALGNWSVPFISVAAFLTMFSTTITCLDAFPRVMHAIALELGITTEKQQQKNYLIALLLIVVATMVILLFFVKNMRGMVDFATTISFVTAPIFALLNYLVVTDRAFPTDFQVKGTYKLFALISVIVLTLFTCSYIWMKLFL
jgi:Mn2+/Fe2+ NRAMP family transporter